MEETTLHPYWSRTYSDYGFSFPAHNASAKTTIQGLTEHLFNVMVFHTVLPLTKELTSQPENCDSGPTIMGFNGLTMFLTIQKHLL